MRHKYGHIALLAVTVLLIGLASLSAAAHNVSGSTGLINIPSASVAPSGSISAAYHSFNGTSHISMVLVLFPELRSELPLALMILKTRCQGMSRSSS